MFVGPASGGRNASGICRQAGENVAGRLEFKRNLGKNRVHF